MLTGALVLIALVVISTIVLVIVAMHWGAGDSPPEAARTASKARLTLAAIIVAVAIASVAFRLISGYGLQQSAALFIGIPALLALAAVFSPTPQSATGVACRTVTIGLLFSLIFLGEGMLCVVMSAPLFYGVAIVVGGAIDYARRRNPRPGRRFGLGRGRRGWLFTMAVLVAPVYWLFHPPFIDNVMLPSMHALGGL